MSGGAMIGAAVIGAGAAVYSSKEASDSANKAAASADSATAVQYDQLAFQQQQYADWQEIYDPIQEQLGEYYKNYTGEAQVSQQLTDNNKAYITATEDLTRQLAQRGLSGSGAEAQALTSLANNQATNEATIRANQDEIAAQAQMGFLSLGLGQGSNLMGNMTNTANSIGNSAASYNNMAYNYNNQATQGWNNLAGNVSSGLTQYGMAQALQNQQWNNHINSLPYSTNTSVGV